MNPSDRQQLENWINQQTNKFLGFQNPDVVSQLLTLQTEDELDDFINNLFGSTPAVKRFSNRLKSRRQEYPQLMFSKRVIDKAPPQGATVYRKGEIQQNNNNNNNNKSKKSNTKKNNNKSNNNKNNKNSNQKKKPTTITNIDEIESVIIRPGEVCECQATLHKLVTNCIDCGRVICKQEAGDYCLFCGSWLNEKKAMSDDAIQAELHKQRLLMYDRQTAQRTKVFDDQADYFDTNDVWLDEDERKKRAAAQKEIEEAKQNQRARLTVTIDFAGRKILTPETRETIANRENDVRFQHSENKTNVNEEMEKADLERALKASMIDNVPKTVPKEKENQIVIDNENKVETDANVETNDENEEKTNVKSKTVTFSSVIRIAPSDNLKMLPKVTPKNTKSSKKNAKSSTKKTKSSEKKAKIAAKKAKSVANEAKSEHVGKVQHHYYGDDDAFYQI